MFHETMRAAIEGARTLAQMDELSRQVWQGHASGALGDDDAQNLAERLHGRRNAIREGIRPVGIPPGRATLFPPRARSVRPDRLASRDRRRLLACSGPMPPQLAARFTTGQLAVLRIVADEVATRGQCGLCVDAIAARAGVCRRLAQAAIRLAEGDGLLVIQERRHQGRKNDTNIIRIISREWALWMKRGGRQMRSQLAFELSQSAGRDASKAIGCKSPHPTDRRVVTLGKTRPMEPKEGLPGRQGRLEVSGSREFARAAEAVQAML